MIYFQKVGTLIFIIICVALFPQLEKRKTPWYGLKDYEQNILCDRIELSAKNRFIDTLRTNDEIVILENGILSKPVEGSLFLVYRDTIQFFSELTYTEYFKIVDRKVQLRLIK